MYLTEFARHANTAARMRKLIRARGETARGFLVWKNWEDDICRQIYPDYSALRKALPHRTQAALQKRCSALGIQRKVHRWTAKEISDLRRMYSSAGAHELRERFTRFSTREIRRKAQELGLQRLRKPYQKSGNSLLDALRERAHDQNLTMLHLDEFAQSGEYFHRRYWRIGKGKIKYDIIVKAIQELGGRLTVDWGVEQ